MNRSIKFLSHIVVAMSLCIVSDLSSAAALYFEKVQVKTASEKTCMGFASDVARNAGLQRIHQSPLEVAGEKSGAYASMTCVGRGKEPAVAVVMVTSEDLSAAKNIATDLANRIKGITCFEGC